jgi:hypothetical protein
MAMEKNNKELNKVRRIKRMKKDDYIKELEMKNRELVLINQLLNQKIHSAFSLLKEPVIINSDWAFGNVEEARKRFCVDCKETGDKTKLVYIFEEDRFICFPCKKARIDNKNNNSNGGNKE